MILLKNQLGGGHLCEGTTKIHHSCLLQTKKAENLQMPITEEVKPIEKQADRKDAKELN